MKVKELKESLEKVSEDLDIEIYNSATDTANIVSSIGEYPGDEETPHSFLIVVK